MNIFKEYAPQYIDKDIKPVPCIGKAPMVSDWSNVTFEDKINDYADWSIGIQTGKVSNIVIVDIDTKDKELQEKFYSKLPPLLSGKTGDKSKGNNYFFQYPSDRKVQTRKFGAVLDILSDGCFSVMPPSKHPDHNYNYEWLGESLLDIDLDDLPVFTQEIENDLLSVVPKYLKEKEQTFKQLEKSDGSRCKHGSHNYLSSVVKACVHQEVARSQAVQEVLTRDSEINESVSYFACPSRKEFKTADTFKNAVMFVSSAYDRSIKEKEIDSYPPEPPISIEIDFEEKPIKEVVFENKLPTPTGKLKELQDAIYAASPRGRKTLSLASAISTLGSVFSHRIRWDMTTPNIYQVMISISSGGKDAPLKHPQEILSQTMGAKFIGAISDSRASFMQTLQAKPKMIMCVDEVNRIFEQMNNSRGFLSGLAEDLSTIYSGSRSFYGGKTTKGFGTEGFCHSPHVSFLGACTDESLLKSLKLDNITQGFGGRVLYMIDSTYTKKKKRRDIKPLELSDDLRRFLCFWNKLDPETTRYDLTGRGIMVYEANLETQKPELKELESVKQPIINNAFCLDEPFDDEINDYYESLVEKSSGDSISQAIYGRAHENYSKIALIHACSRLGDAHTIVNIERQDMEFAKQYVDYCLERFIHFATVRMGESFEKKKETKVINAIRNNFNGHEFNKRQLTQKVGFGGNELKMILSSLVTNGTIVVTNKEYAKLQPHQAMTKHGVKFMLLN